MRTSRTSSGKLSLIQAQNELFDMHDVGRWVDALMRTHAEEGMDDSLLKRNPLTLFAAGDGTKSNLVIEFPVESFTWVVSTPTCLPAILIECFVIRYCMIHW